jgi:hypothetical protein
MLPPKEFFNATKMQLPLATALPLTLLLLLLLLLSRCMQVPRGLQASSWLPTAFRHHKQPC